MEAGTLNGSRRRFPLASGTLVVSTKRVCRHGRLRPIREAAAAGRDGVRGRTRYRSRRERVAKPHGWSRVV